MQYQMYCLLTNGKYKKGNAQLINSSNMHKARTIYNEIIEKRKKEANDNKAKKNKKSQIIEFDKIRIVQNQYSDIVPELNQGQARCLDIAHESMEKYYQKGTKHLIRKMEDQEK